MFRSIVALVGGFAIFTFATIAFAVVATLTLPLSADHPTTGQIVANLLPWLGAAVCGGYATAALAPQRQRMHAAAFTVMVLVATASQIGKPQTGQPTWYPLSIALVGTLGAAVGGLLRRPRTPTVQAT